MNYHEHEFSTFGRHIILDVWGVDFQMLNDRKWLENIMKKCAILCGAQVVSSQSKQFEPQGITISVLLSESHFNIHTYPEKGYASLDCYTCGEFVNPEIAIAEIIKFLNPDKSIIKKLIRGTGEIEIVESNISNIPV